MKAILRIMTYLAALTVLVQLESLFSTLDPVVSFLLLLAAVGFAGIWIGINEANLATNPDEIF